jgi:hypothetical protein
VKRCRKTQSTMACSMGPSALSNTNRSTTSAGVVHSGQSTISRVKLGHDVLPLVVTERRRATPSRATSEMPSVADPGSGYRTAARISRPWSVARRQCNVPTVRARAMTRLARKSS